jgi:hypothetical protein
MTDTIQEGGAFRLQDSSLLIDDCNFSNNAAPKGAGGAISIEGGNLVITDSAFRANVAMDGGVLAMINAELTVQNSNFVDNDAESGGAMILSGVDGSITGSTFLRNTASTKVGGALTLANIKLTLSDTTFSDNVATQTLSFDIFILDDAPGTSLTCGVGVVFCDGRSGIRQNGVNDNTNCDEQGLVGTPGQGTCPA